MGFGVESTSIASGSETLRPLSSSVPFASAVRTLLTTSGLGMLLYFRTASDGGHFKTYLSIANLVDILFATDFSETARPVPLAPFNWARGAAGGAEGVTGRAFSAIVEVIVGVLGWGLLVLEGAGGVDFIEDGVGGTA